MLLLRFVFIFSLFFGIQIAKAQTDNPIDINYQEGLAKDTSTCNIYTCAFEAYAKWDKAMDKEYNRLLKTLKTDKDKAALKQAQNTWTAYRDNEFKVYDNIFNHPGNNWVLLRANGRIDVVRARALQLKSFNEAFDKKKNKK